jgi:hypothetical protein
MMNARRNDRERLTTVFSTKTASRKEKEKFSTELLNVSTDSEKSWQDSCEIHSTDTTSGESVDTNSSGLQVQDSREGSCESVNKKEDTNASSPDGINFLEADKIPSLERKRSRRSSRKGLSMDKDSSHHHPRINTMMSASVRRLRPSKALLQLESASVADCVKAMIEHRTEATLVTDANGVLTGILTDKVDFYAHSLYLNMWLMCPMMYPIS